MKVGLFLSILVGCLPQHTLGIQARVRITPELTKDKNNKQELVLAAEATILRGRKKETPLPWTMPHLPDTAAFRSIASITIMGALVVAGFTLTDKLSARTLSSIHLFSFSTWFGTLMYTTFVLGITMFNNLPRQTFGKLQAKLFPKYFAFSSIAIVLQVRPDVRLTVCALTFIHLRLPPKCISSLHSEVYQGIAPGPLLCWWSH